MKKWLEFLKERNPLTPNIIMIVGILLSLKSLSGITFSVLSFSIAAFTIYLFLLELRFMDELKDYKKDLVAHPTRPLPRGLIAVEEIKKMINIILVLFVFIIAGIFFINKLAAMYLTITIGWLFLMYKEFFVEEWLNKRPLIYATTHQIIIIPLCLFAAAMLSGQVDLTSWGYALLGIGSFFTFEICRKLDPNSHKILGTYLVAFGINKVILLNLITLSTALVGGYLLSSISWVIPACVLMILTLIKLKYKPEKFKDAEGMSGLLLIFHLWMPAIQELVRSF